MIQSLRRLAAPLNYVRIKHPTKSNYDLWIPLIITMLMLILFYLAPFQIDLYSNKGIIHIITSIIGILTGFFIASLAAVSTFNKPSMDEKLPGSDMTLTVLRNGVQQTELMTPRKLLSYLFGYLSFISIIIYFSGELAILMAPDIKAALPPIASNITEWIFAFIYLFLFNNLITNTFTGIFFMSDHIHRE